jgi:hypothetical protein
MIKIRAGWERLITAQLLWVAATTIRTMCNLRVQVSEDDPCINWERGQTLQWTLGIMMERMRAAALLMAHHTCEVCGAATFPHEELPVRCSEHTNSPLPTIEIDVEQIMDTPTPGSAIAEMAKQCIDVLFIGDVDMASAQMQVHDDLFCAGFARHECSFLGDPFAPAVANVLLRALQEMNWKKWIGRNQVDAAVNEPDAAEQLSSSPELLAASTVWAHYGFSDANLKSQCKQAVARHQALQAAQAIETMMKGLQK